MSNRSIHTAEQLHLPLIIRVTFSQDLGCHAGIVHELVAEKEGLDGTWRLLFIVGICFRYTSTWIFIGALALVVHWGHVLWLDEMLGGQCIAVFQAKLI